MRVIIHSTLRGTYLDYHGFFGWSFFSGDSGDIAARVKAKQTARTFADESEAQAFIEGLGGYADLDGRDLLPMDLQFVPVQTDAEYAPVDVCVAAGIPKWDAPAVEPIAPFQFEFHEGDVGHTVVVGRVGSGKSVLLPRFLSIPRNQAGK